jgi:4-oxalocrotonate tautomerase
MPFVRIDVPDSASPSQRRAIADVVYGAMRETLNVPEKDRFQVIAGHAAGDMIIDRPISTSPGARRRSSSR